MCSSVSGVHNTVGIIKELDFFFYFLRALDGCGGPHL